MERQPKNLDEAVEMILQDIHKQNAEEYVIENGIPHHGTGTALRNELGLWWQEDWVEKYGKQKPPLVEWFNQKKIYHADDMSGTIFAAVEAKLKGEPFDLDSHLQIYFDHWAKYGSDGKGM